MIDMTCDEISLLLSAYQDGELDGERSARVALHLAKCKECQKELSLLEDVYARVKGLKEVEPVQNFTALVMTKIKEPARTRWFAVPALPRLVYSFVFALFLLLGFLVTAFITNPGGTVSPQEEEAYISSLLAESQHLGLINVQDQTIAMLYKNHDNGEASYEK